MDEDYYKGHRIQITEKHLPNRRWAPHVRITWNDGSAEERKDFNIKRGFVTQNDAEWEGLRFTRKWIDEAKPKVRDDVAN
jgi:hypothetical protein